MSHARPRQPSVRHPQVAVYLIGGTDVVYGSVYTLGGWAASPALLMMQRFLPMWAWGMIVLVGGMLLLLGREQWGGWLAGAVFSFFALTSVISVIQRTAQSSAGWALLILIASLHVLITYDASTSRRNG